VIATLVDTNVLLDVLDEDPLWQSASESALARCADQGPVCINVVIYAEVSTNFRTLEEVDAALPPEYLTWLEVPPEAAFLAAKAYLAYRRAGGVRTAVLPDFFIGAHAAVTQMPLLTRDPRRYRTYFPTVELVTP
jgi:predicted nucleic acid-binding protein